jgi:hypothetical protein
MTYEYGTSTYLDYIDTVPSFQLNLHFSSGHWQFKHLLANTYLMYIYNYIISD